MGDRVSVPEHCSGLFLYGMVQIGPWAPRGCYEMHTTVPIAGSMTLASPSRPPSGPLRHSQRLASSLQMRGKYHLHLLHGTKLNTIIIYHNHVVTSRTATFL